MRKKIVLSADDFAMHPHIDTAIVTLIAEGRLTATSCLTLAPDWKSAANQLDMTIQAKADIGLHLDLTEFQTALSYKLPALIAASYCRQLPIDTLAQCIDQQLDLFEDQLGRMPDYIDGHQHVHQLPQVRTQLIKRLQHRYRQTMPWIRLSAVHAGGIKGRLIGALGAYALKRATRHSAIKTNHRLLGVYTFDYSAEQYAAACGRWLAYAQSGDALMFHPAAATWPQDMISPSRLIEYRFLRSAHFAEQLSLNDVIPSRGHALLHSE